MKLEVIDRKLEGMNNEFNKLQEHGDQDFVTLSDVKVSPRTPPQELSFTKVKVESRHHIERNNHIL